MELVNWANVTSWASFLAVPNTTTGSWFWTIIVYILFGLVVMFNSAWGFEVGLLMGGFVGLILSLLLAYAGLVSWPLVLFFISIIVLTFLYIAFTTKKY